MISQRGSHCEVHSAAHRRLVLITGSRPRPHHHHSLCFHLPHHSRTMRGLLPSAVPHLLHSCGSRCCPLGHGSPASSTQGGAVRQGRNKSRSRSGAGQARSCIHGTNEILMAVVAAKKPSLSKSSNREPICEKHMAEDMQRSDCGHVAAETLDTPPSAPSPPALLLSPNPPPVLSLWNDANSQAEYM